jgi:asparagine synthase (glutamine-hydrolysing)
LCGIIGRVSSTSYFDEKSLCGQLSKLNHRGPDHSQLWISVDKRVAFGHARLSIQDLSSSSNQPMVSNCGGYCIVYNGEIYNFKEVRETLESKGYRFFSQGDTEVVLNSYIEWGSGCLERLNGMFAFAIYVSEAKNGRPSIFLARDRVGEKPLYYQFKESEFSFASELKALEVDHDVNLNALNHYLALGYVPNDMCLYEGVNKLPAAHCAEFDINNGSLKVWRYWSLPPYQPNHERTGPELAQIAGGLIENSVKLRLSADVPVGVLLSGGLDSSLVAAAAARVSSAPIKTFTVALPGSSLDESRYAKQVSSYLGTDHHELELNKPNISFLDELASIVDEPIADSSILPSWLVFRLASTQVKVALGGDGGDELFGGYSHYLTSLKDKQRLRYIPPSLYKSFASLISHLPAGLRGRNRISSLRGGPIEQLIWGGPYFDTVLRSRIIKNNFWGELGMQQNDPEEFLLSLFRSGSSDIDSMTRTNFGSILPDDFLFKVDRASMAHSLELRSPMLDHHLVEFCFSQIPDDWKVSGGQTRRLQRQIGKMWLPSDLDTNRKQGFSIPVNEWLRAESETNLMSRMEFLPEAINLDEVRSVVRGHLTGRNNGGRIFALIMLSLSMENMSR